MPHTMAASCREPQFAVRRHHGCCFCFRLGVKWRTQPGFRPCASGEPEEHARAISPTKSDSHCDRQGNVSGWRLSESQRELIGALQELKADPQMATIPVPHDRQVLIGAHMMAEITASRKRAKLTGIKVLIRKTLYRATLFIRRTRLSLFVKSC
jgi:hypothetical protein